jgi:hypothetical protein
MQHKCPKRHYLPPLPVRTDTSHSGPIHIQIELGYRAAMLMHSMRTQPYRLEHGGVGILARESWQLHGWRC